MLSTLLLALVLSAETPPPLTSAAPMVPAPYPGQTGQPTPQQMPQQEAEPQHIGNAFSLYIGFFEPSIAVLGSAVFGSVTGSANASLRIGGVFGGRHALLFGLAGSVFTISTGWVLLGTIAPQYRVHFRPLVPGNISPFLQIEGVLGFLLAPGFNGASAVLGFGPGFGVEMLFTKNFGIVGALGGRLSYVAIPMAETVAATLWVSAALAFHL